MSCLLFQHATRVQCIIFMNAMLIHEHHKVYKMAQEKKKKIAPENISHKNPVHSYREDFSK